MGNRASINNNKGLLGGGPFYLRSILNGIAMVFSCILLSVGCGTQTAKDTILMQSQSKELTETFFHEGIRRSYHIHLPPGFRSDRPSPLVLALHGGGGQGRRFDRSITRGTLVAAADSRGVVLVFPEAVKSHWFDGRAEILETERGYDDAGFISVVIDRMVKNYGIDSGRLYATGISNGGFMSIRLAMDFSEKIAAVAPVAAQLSMVLKDKTPRFPISIMIINGTMDPLVPFDGGHIGLAGFGRSRGEIMSTAETVEHFRLHNGCDRTPEMRRIPNRAPDDGTDAWVEKYANGRDGTEAILVRVKGGGHSWPGGGQYFRPKIIGAVCRDFNASEMILEFFLRHKRP